MCLTSAYSLGEADEGAAQFAVVSVHRGLSVSAPRVLAANHVVQLRSGDQPVV